MQFVGADDKPLGIINWFAVHPTSMNNTNHLVSSDNVGYASILFEKMMNNNGTIGKVRPQDVADADSPGLIVNMYDIAKLPWRVFRLRGSASICDLTESQIVRARAKKSFATTRYPRVYIPLPIGLEYRETPFLAFNKIVRMHRCERRRSRANCEFASAYAMPRRRLHARPLSLSLLLSRAESI